MAITSNVPAHHLPRFVCALLIATSALSPTARANSEAQYQAQLKQVWGQIAAIQKSITTKQAQRGKLIGALKQSELKIASIAERIHDIDAQSQRAQRDLRRRDARAAQLSLALNQHRKSLKQLVKAAYQTGSTSRIQLFLSQQDPALISRMFNYYDYFNRLRREKIEQALALLNELRQVRNEQVRITQNLKNAHEALRGQHTEMQQAREKRRANIAELERSLSRDGGLLSKLQRDRQDLEQLLEQLNQAFAAIPAPPLEHKPFKLMRGKLPWPVLGPLHARYNTIKGATGLRWKGMLIGARAGSEVRAIYHGRIAFADWMNGFGLLAIIDHGDGYMSIYANNRELRKAQGEWVTPGEIIATTGDSGGQSSVGTYFEMRRNARPINPHRWVKKSVKFASAQ